MTGCGLSGRIRDFPAQALLQMLCLSSRTGTLILREGERGGRIDLQDGTIARASVVPAQTNLGDLLVRAGVLTKEALAETVRRQCLESNRRPLGELLIEMGLVEGAHVQAALRRQVLAVLHDLMTWKNGEFIFEACRRLHVDDITHGVPEMLLEATIELDTMLEQREGRGSGNSGTDLRDGPFSAAPGQVLFYVSDGPVGQALRDRLGSLGAVRLSPTPPGAAARRILGSGRKGAAPVLILDATDEASGSASDCADRAADFLRRCPGLRMLALHQDLSPGDRLRLARAGVRALIEIRPGSPGIRVEILADDLESALGAALRVLPGREPGDFARFDAPHRNVQW